MKRKLVRFHRAMEDRNVCVHVDSVIAVSDDYRDRFDRYIGAVLHCVGGIDLEVREDGRQVRLRLGWEEPETGR